MNLSTETGKVLGTPAVAAAADGTAAGSWKKPVQSAWVEIPVVEGRRRDWMLP